MLRSKIKNKLTKLFFNDVGNQHMKISFSQSGEDLIVKYIFDNLGINNPNYIDIGAHHPYFISNTALFYKNGCRGINIEPDPNLYSAFLHCRKEDINLNIGISNTNSEQDFFTISSPSLNTFSKEAAENYSNEGNYHITGIKKIRVKTLKKVLKEYSNGDFPQFLSIDAEGIDELIIKEIDFEKNFPIVICIETISFSNDGNGVKNKALVEYIEKNGYLVYADTYINTIFVRKSFWQR